VSNLPTFELPTPTIARSGCRLSLRLHGILVEDRRLRLDDDVRIRCIRYMLGLVGA
jgi:hypothetical protein